ncbi:MFS transporter [Cellulomonas xylanilytica]|uniref:MFS transporter n=1 Tax=Cellulomonas xylanilytica TaxID=233583 RepID=A0A510V799_9CELL|nr:MFS transporter [Cellulomonas xylanilytica]GEK22747.1 MFS transporter [Cellulomonas xylanilytica]
MRERWTLAVLGTAFFVVVLDSTIVYVALPSIADDLAFAGGGVQWVISAYLVTFGGLLLLGGRVADLLGRRRVFLVGIAVFTGASVLCGSASEPAVLVGARVLQGMGAAVMAPTALSLVLVTFEPGLERNRALGVWGGIGGVGGTAGLLLGGPITQLWGWKWIFLANLPVGVLLLVASARLLAESRDADRPRAFDASGALAVTGALVLLVLGITEASWPALAGSALLLGTFVLVERRAVAPLVPWRVVRSRRLVTGNLLLLVAGTCVDGVLLVLALDAQAAGSRSPVHFGLTTAAMTGASVVGSVVGQAVVTRVGVRAVAVAGTALLAAGSVALTTLPAVGLVVFGAGLGAAFVSAQIAAVSGAAPDDSGLAAGIADTSFAVGGALGVAVLSTVEGTGSALVVAAIVAALGLVAATSLGAHRATSGVTHLPAGRAP